MEEGKWYRLDTAAKIYPAIMAPEQASVFRLSCILKDTIRPDLLAAALDITLRRYPGFCVRLEKGAFWCYFEHNPNQPKIRKEKYFPCQMIEPKKNRNFLFIVSWFSRRINLEIFHVLTDGTGGAEFLKTLVFYYLLFSGKPVQSDGLIKTMESISADEELENAFQRYYNSEGAADRKEKKAFHLKGTPLVKGNVGIIQAQIPLDQLKKLAKTNNATITEYLTAVLNYVFLHSSVPNSLNEVVKISVPVNLRKYFPSQTLRNFSFFFNMAIPFSEKDSSFERILAETISQFKEMNQKDILLKRFSMNVLSERNAFLRIAPLDLKHFAMKKTFEVVGDDLFTCGFSNLGPFILPVSMSKYIERFDFVLSTSATIPLTSSMCSFENTFSISFSSTIQETIIEREFFRFLTERGLVVTIESNSRKFNEENNPAGEKTL